MLANASKSRMASSTGPVSINRVPFERSTASPKSSQLFEVSATKAKVVVDKEDNITTIIKEPTRYVIKRDPLNWHMVSHIEQQKMTSTSTIILKVGNVRIHGIPRCAIKNALGYIQGYFAKDPADTYYEFKAGLVHPEAVVIILTVWIQSDYGEIPLKEVEPQGDFYKDIALLRAARFLGMEKYTKNILRKRIAYMSKSPMPHRKEIELVEKYKASNLDPVWINLINRLCRLRHKKLMPDPDAFAKFLKEHPKLSMEMSRTDDYWRKEVEENKHQASEIGKQAQEKQRAAAEEKAKQPSGGYKDAYNPAKNHLIWDYASNKERWVTAKAANRWRRKMV